MSATIKFYSKKGCSPCDYWGKIASQRMKEDKFEIVKFDKDEDLIPIMEKFGQKHVPFIVINDKTVINGREMDDLIWAMRGGC